MAPKNNFMSPEDWELVQTTRSHMGCNGCIHVSIAESLPDPLSLLTLCHLGGGMPLTTNRTLWPVGGGAIAVQPGWFQGHATAYFYFNLGLGTLPTNMSLPMTPVFEITGPSKQAYAGGFCIPQVPLPAGVTPNIGDNATIQVVEAAVHGAALYSVSLLSNPGQDQLVDWEI